MAKPEWGAKRLCPSCGTRFYNLKRDPVDCPNCGATFALEALSERKAGGSPSRAKPKPPKPAPVAAESEALIDDDSGESESLGNEDPLLEDEDEDSDDLGEISDVASSDKEEDT